MKDIKFLLVLLIGNIPCLAFIALAAYMVHLDKGGWWLPVIAALMFVVLPEYKSKG